MREPAHASQKKTAVSDCDCRKQEQRAVTHGVDGLDEEGKEVRRNHECLWLREHSAQHPHHYDNGISLANRLQKSSASRGFRKNVWPLEGCQRRHAKRQTATNHRCHKCVCHTCMVIVPSTSLRAEHGQRLEQARAAGWRGDVQQSEPDQGMQLTRLSPQPRQQLTRLSPQPRQQLTRLSPQPRQQLTRLSPQPRQQLTRLSPQPRQQLTRLSPQPRQQLTRLSPQPRQQLTRLSPQPRQQLTRLSPQPRQQLTRLSPQPRQQLTRLSPQPRQQLTIYHRPTTSARVP